VADSGTARILRATRRPAAPGGTRRGAIQLEEILRIENAAAHLPSKAMVTDKTGRVFDAAGRVGQGPKSHARHGAQSDYDPHDAEADRFAQRLADHIEAERGRLDLEELVVIAGPRFLGRLRQQLSPASRKVVVREIDLDLVHADNAKIRRAAFATTG